MRSTDLHWPFWLEQKAMKGRSKCTEVYIFAVCTIYVYEWDVYGAYANDDIGYLCACQKICFRSHPLSVELAFEKHNTQTVQKMV